MDPQQISEKSWTDLVRSELSKENDNRLNPSQTLGSGEWKKNIYDKFIEPTEN